MKKDILSQIPENIVTRYNMTIEGNKINLTTPTGTITIPLDIAMVQNETVVDILFTNGWIKIWKDVDQFIVNVR